MSDTTIKKVNVNTSPTGIMGQQYLVSGVHIGMRLWKEEPGDELEAPSQRDYETVGYALQGRAELNLEGQQIVIEAGDSWLVPKGAQHTYKILESFIALEATHPPAHVHARDE